MSENEFQYLVSYRNGRTWEGRICLFDSHTNSVKQITKFTIPYELYEVATTQNKVNFYGCYFE